MELLTGEIDASPIVGFCKSVVSRHAETWPPKDETLAEEFVEWLGLKPFLTRDQLIELCLAKRVILSFVELPPELRGFNCSFQDKTEIVITQHETVLGADLHNISHEFREVLENGFVELGHSTLGAGDSLEVRAEHFAMSARMMVVLREVPGYIETVNNAEAKWIRYLGYGVLGIVGLFYLLSCVLLPHFEEIESQTNANVTYVRNVGTRRGESPHVSFVTHQCDYTLFFLTLVCNSTKFLAIFAGQALSSHNCVGRCCEESSL